MESIGIFPLSAQFGASSSKYHLYLSFELASFGYIILCSFIHSTLQEFFSNRLEFLCSQRSEKSSSSNWHGNGSHWSLWPTSLAFVLANITLQSLCYNSIHLRLNISFTFIKKSSKDAGMMWRSNRTKGIKKKGRNYPHHQLALPSEIIPHV